jgi:hypothetical protein
MIELLLFMLMIVFFALFFDIEKEKIHIISFEGSPLEIVTKNNRPVLYRYDEKMQGDILKAWKQHLKDIDEMSKAERSLSSSAYRRKCEMDQFWKLEEFKSKSKKE